MTLREYDLVRLRHPLPQHGLPEGAVGTILMAFEKPRRAYEVEFCAENGVTLALVTLDECDIEKVASPKD
jgi:hypothetical protein